MQYLLEVLYALRGVWDGLGSQLFAGVPVTMLLIMVFMVGVAIRLLRRVFK